MHHGFARFISQTAFDSTNLASLKIYELNAPPRPLDVFELTCHGTNVEQFSRYSRLSIYLKPNIHDLLYSIKHNINKVINKFDQTLNK